ncbi:tryptophan--tRNA ligase [Candidatus Zinderia endosymbiont of Aphrophora alni]|uniref:tryptophan--tRNA ligase n=1 Tax=Candidatus Zinderia endosymbiont of Aphrophora alni TaxID=3077951 RepID=UPI0030D32F90
MFKTNIVVSGIRPTGILHLGHYFGILKTWLKLQTKFPCFFFIADLHAFNTHYNKYHNIKFNIKSIIIDLLSIGIDPIKSTIFIQSKIPEHSELYLLLSMITPINWLKRIPSYKSKINKNLTYGFLGYPILQAADILLYRANKIPIGKDQIPHIEIVKKISKKFNFLYKLNKNFKNNFYFQKPKIILSKTTCLPGINGLKMSKSYSNTIGIREKKKSIFKKIMKMRTDPNRKYKYINGNPEICTVWQFHLIYSNFKIKKYINDSCRSSYIGCVECKEIIINSIYKKQQPILENAQKYLDNPKFVKNIIKEGCLKARKVAKKNIHKIYNIINKK